MATFTDEPLSPMHINQHSYVGILGCGVLDQGKLMVASSVPLVLYSHVVDFPTLAGKAIEQSGYVKSGDVYLYGWLPVANTNVGLFQYKYAFVGRPSPDAMQLAAFRLRSWLAHNKSVQHVHIQMPIQPGATSYAVVKNILDMLPAGVIFHG